MFSSIFRLGKQAKYSFCRPHNLRSLFNQQILVAPTAVRFQMDFKQAHSLASKKKRGKLKTQTRTYSYELSKRT